MKTPIYDFVSSYINSGTARMHMPGHKGNGMLNCEARDITEIPGADSLYEADGIIRQSERNAASLFGTSETFYSTEGSSQCIKAMLYLALLARSKEEKSRPVIIAARNAHRAFLSAAALLDFDIKWLWPKNKIYSLCRCDVGISQLEAALQSCPNAAGVFLTSPDYLGNIADIPAAAELSHRYGVPLLVDNAHGAYLNFLDPPLHPLKLGADICCDSAHKTLPVLTGGAYLHISEAAPPVFKEYAKQALLLFGSTSPSYIILQSLDLANKYISDGYAEKLADTAHQISSLKNRLSAAGWVFPAADPLKITVNAKKCGYTGIQLSEYLQTQEIVCEYADPDYTVLMVSTENSKPELSRLEAALSVLEKHAEIHTTCFELVKPETAVSVRNTFFKPGEKIPTEKALGRICADSCASCPPAVAPVTPGEIINKSCIDILKYYGVTAISVLKKER